MRGSIQKNKTFLHTKHSALQSTDGGKGVLRRSTLKSAHRLPCGLRSFLAELPKAVMPSTISFLERMNLWEYTFFSFKN